MSIVSTVGIDLAKNVVSVHAVGAQGAVAVRRTVSRAKLIEVVAQLSPCAVITASSSTRPRQGQISARCNCCGRRFIPSC